MKLIKKKIGWRKRLVDVIIILVTYLGLCFYLAHAYLHPKRFHSMISPRWIKEVQVPSAKGPVPTWASPRLAAGDGRPIVFVLAYGYGGDRSVWVDTMLELDKRGFETIAPSMPGQDASPDDSVGFGVKESKMVVDTVKWVRGQYKKPPKIILYGVSMGGAAVWLASEQDPTVDAVVSEGAYARFDQTMDHWLNQNMTGSSFYLRPMIWIASAQAQIDPSTIRPVDSAAKWRKPALVVQGAEDKRITMDQAVALSEAAHCPLWLVPGAGHASCYLQAHDEYLKRLTDIAHKL